MSETRINRDAFARAIHAHLYGIPGGQAAFAERVRVSPSVICRILGKQRLPSAENYLAICREIDADPMSFVEVNP
jgi:DNA-binding transcriptional regulator YdaS (Cro superfamily)